MKVNGLQLVKKIKKSFLSLPTSPGFTLIELLISMAIFMLIGTLILIVFSSAIRGSDRSQSLISLRQNGSYALTQISRSIRQAEAITNVSYKECSQPSGHTALSIVSAFDHQVTTFSCSETNISSESARGITEFLDNSDTTTVSSCTFSCGTETSGTQFVTVSIKLLPTAENAAADNRSPLDFTTTVYLRNSQSN
jgi:type II secretory pathway pseudopilin PulG